LGNFKQAANAFAKALKLDPYLPVYEDEKSSFQKVLEKAGATKEAARLKKLQSFS